MPSKVERKLIRAEQHIRALKKSVARYSRSQPHKVIPKAKGKKKVHVAKRPPVEISILAGEAVYQMRSALDHLVFQIIKKNSATLHTGWQKNCSFPIWLARPTRTPPVPKSAFSRQLPGISDAAFACIEGMQPYNGTNAVRTCLRFLGHLSDIDKHRYLNVMCARVRKTEYVRGDSGFGLTTEETIDHRALINPPDFGKAERAVYVHRRYRTFVTFKETKYLGNATSLPVDKLLNGILDVLRTYVVPALRKFV